MLLPRSNGSISALLDRLEAESLECHSVMVVRHGHVVGEAWWAPYSADRPHLLYSLTKSFTAIAVGLAIADGLLTLDDRVVDVLPDRVPDELPDQGRRITVHHLLSMTAGHDTDSLAEAWQLEPDDLVKGFLRVPFAHTEGTRHTYDNATTYVLARMVERVTGQGLPEFLDERLFHPMGIEHAEWDRVASGAAFGFHGLHLTTEAVAAFGELLLRGGWWGDRQLVPREWIELATRRHIATEVDPAADDWSRGYGYQFWMSRHGFRGDGAFGQMCLVIPDDDLVIVVTGANEEAQPVLNAIWSWLGDRDRPRSLPMPTGVATGPDSPNVQPVDGGWLLRLSPTLTVEVGHGEWRESAPLGRPVVAAGAWQGTTFIADLYVITTPHRVRIEVTADQVTTTWNVEPLTTPDLELHLRAPLMTRPDVA